MNPFGVLVGSARLITGLGFSGGRLRRKNVCLFAVCALLVVLRTTVDAQQSGQVFQVGYLDDSSAAGTAEVLEVFRHQMSQLGWLEGKNISFEYRFSEGKGLDQLAKLAAELVRLKVNVIVTSGDTGTRAAQKLTTAIPIVMAGVGDPVVQGLIPSLARPGGNTTGLATLAPDLGGKRLEILKEALPRATRIGVILGGAGQGAKRQLKEMSAASSALGLILEDIGVASDREQLVSAFQTAMRERVHAIMTTSGPVVFSQRKNIVALAINHRLPGMYPQKEFADEGGLMSYGIDTPDMYRRAAVYVDKILKGAKPADLPVEQPTKFEFVINLKTAKQIGLTIPPNVLVRADRVIR